MAPSSVQYPNCTLMPANFSPLAGVDELQELFKGGFSAMVTGLLQDEEMPVAPEEVPVAKEESPIKTIPQETLGRATASSSPQCNPSSSPARMTPWLYALDKQIECLEETIEINEVEVYGMSLKVWEHGAGAMLPAEGDSRTLEGAANLRGGEDASSVSL
ncbi:hypothetical protein EDC04DRAFT_2610403 [Pisolithus marmoratus]|nr:hypothetical protein EDC04DRAFT_2610403 [Pisolithus marmoratus]